MKEKIERTIDQRMQELRTMRDELRVKATLAKADAKDAWKAMEKRFNELEQTLKVNVDLKADAVKKEVLSTLDELDAAYRRMRKDMNGASAKTDQGTEAR